MRKIIYVATLAIPMILVAPISDAAIKAGNTCTKQGAKQISGGKSFKCMKQGNRLIWKKTTSSQKPVAPEATLPTPSPTPSPTTNLTPSPTTEPTSWDKLLEYPQEISYWAWKKAHDKIVGANSKLGDIKISISPNAIPDNPSPLIALNLISKLSAGYKEPSQVQLVYVGEKDIDWGQKLIDEFCAGLACGYDVSGEAKKQCNVPVTPCWGGAALKNRITNIPLIYVTASDWGKTDSNHTQGTLEAHEYFHNIQDLILGSYGIHSVPRWLIEGGAPWAARAAVFHNDFDKYSIRRADENSETISKVKPTTDWIETFLSPSYTTGWDIWNDDRYHQWNVYDVGSLATEIMVALKGPDAFLNLFKEVGEGKMFTQAFEENFGISWPKGARLIADAIVLQQR